MAKDTWFENHKLPMESVMFFIYGFVNKYTYEDFKRELERPGFELSDSTIADWLSYCREVCMVDLDIKYEGRGRLGADVIDPVRPHNPPHNIQVDESKVGRQKYKRDRWKEGSWIVGMVDDETNEIRINICRDNKRDAATLREIIVKYVKPFNNIVTDCWRGYLDLNQRDDNGEFYDHNTVNHSENFVDPVTGDHTQRIESNWRPLKMRVNRGGVHYQYVADHLCEYLWFRDCRKRGIVGKRFAEFKTAIVAINQ